ncbi:hypothetical protein Tco_0882830, partial [Tanacetum coccineum]
MHCTGYEERYLFLHLLSKYVNCSMVCIEIGRRYIRRHLLRLLLRLRQTCPLAIARSKSRPDDGPVVTEFGDWDDNDPTSGYLDMLVVVIKDPLSREVVGMLKVWNKHIRKEAVSIDRDENS